MARRFALLLAGAIVLTPGSATAATRNVSIGDDFFSPARVTAAQGDTVVWTNDGDREHTSTGRLSLWDSGILDSDETFPHDFDEAGAFGYVCALHDWMQGTVRVPIRVSPSSGNTATLFTVRMGQAAAPSGFQYVVQRKRNNGDWKTWRTTTAATATFDPSRAGTYKFRSRLRRVSDGMSSGYSPARAVTVG